jgi:DnaJ-domain-containing protein 1
MAEETKEKEGGGIAGVFEFVLDKGVDFIIAFAGLYLAIWVQNGVDAKKEREAYVQSLNSFKAELTFNRGQLVDTGTIAQTVGDLHVLEAYYQSEASIFENFQQPEQAAEIVQEIDEMTTALDTALEAALPGAKLEDVFARVEQLKPIKLAPNYQDQIWAVYLAGGVNIAQQNAKNTELARELGALYAEFDAIEARVRDIELYYNDKFLPRFAHISAASEDVEGYWYDDETGEPLVDDALLAKLTENQADIAEVAAELNEEISDNYVDLQIATQVLMQKVDDVTNPETGLLVTVTASIDRVNGLIDAELANF